MAQSRSPRTPIIHARWHVASVSTAVERHNLPAPLTRFIGREREKAEIGTLLDDARLLTLTGSGGCGKTRLALAIAATRAARDAADAHPDGVRFVEFAALTDPALVPQAIAAIFGVREEQQRPLLDTLMEALHPRALLLVLDNCEHVIAAVADIVDALLRGCPHLRILATSREALRVPGEVTWRVPSLSLPDSATVPTAAHLAKSEAVQLFVDRVRLQQPAFIPTDENAVVVAAICQRLDGMPLALELAAARASVLSLAQLEARLDNALLLLTGGAELDNLRTAIQWLLATGRIGQGLRITTHLWRFWYVRDRVTEGSRWLTAFIARGRETGEATYDSSARLAWLDALFAAGRLAIFRGEYPATHALMEEMLAVARQHDDPYHIASALMLLGHAALEQGEYPAARTHYEQGIAFAREANHPLWQSILIGSLGITLTMQGEIAAARPLLDESMALLQPLGDVGQLSRLLRWQGVLALLAGKGEQAHASLVEGIALHQRLHSLLGIAESLEVFAALTATRGQFTRALQLSGAAARLRATIAVPAPPYWQDWLTQQIEPARRALGATASADALAAGAAMTTDQAIAEALRSANPATPGDRRTSKETYGGLSARERAVVAEVARGKGNREIADALFVSEKTVEWHIGNSLRKLDFRSRAEIAVWAVAVDLVASPHHARKEKTSS